MILHSLLYRFYVTLHLNDLQQNETDIKKLNKKSRKHWETGKFDAKIFQQTARVQYMLLYKPFVSRALQAQVWGI